MVTDLSYARRDRPAREMVGLVVSPRGWVCGMCLFDLRGPRQFGLLRAKEHVEGRPNPHQHKLGGIAGTLGRLCHEQSVNLIVVVKGVTSGPLWGLGPTLAAARGLGYLELDPGWISELGTDAAGLLAAASSQAGRPVTDELEAQVLGQAAAAVRMIQKAGVQPEGFSVPSEAAEKE